MELKLTQDELDDLNARLDTLTLAVKLVAAKVPGGQKGLERLIETLQEHLPDDSEGHLVRQRALREIDRWKKPAP